MSEPSLTPPATEELDTTVVEDTDAPVAVDENSDAAAVADESGTAADADTGDKAGESGDAAPESYADFELPEGMELDATALDKALPMFKELGLTQEQAQKVVGLYADQIQAGRKAQDEAFSQLMDDWRTKSMSDKEFGGDKFEQNIAIANSALQKFGTPELMQLMKDHGVGNHPEMIRFMLKVGRLTQEDNPGSSVGPSSPERDRVDMLYPNARKA